ncbi:MAG: O-antigen ligase family protein [Bacteroidetes bacterium]|nr:O-antigen ligase family protein [Bacteroidota bacterium]
MSAAELIARPGPSDQWLRHWGSALLVAVFGIGMMLLAFITWKVDWVLPFIPVILIGGIGMWWLFQRPLLNLAVVLSSFVLISDFEEGIQITEVFYGLYYMSFLGYWFFKRLFLDHNPVFERAEEKALWVFLILVTLSIPLTLLFGGTFKLWLGEWLSLSLLAFYFPVKEAVIKYDKGLKVMIGVILFVGLYVLARNGMEYMLAITDAVQAWEIAKGRAVTNEGLLMVPAFFSLAMYLFSVEWKQKTAFLGLFIAFFAGLILTQSRGYWVAFVLGAAILFLLIPRQQKGRLLVTGVVTFAVVFSVAVLALGDVLILVLGGMLDRLLSIGTATTKDISLVNRFLETGAVWEHIKTNPILGHGMGVSYRFYDLTYEFSDSKPFIHNGYFALWYKFGIWGPALILSFLGICIRRAVVVVRRNQGNHIAGTACLAVIACLAAFSLSANTSNPFYINDPMFIFSVMTGIVGGCYSLHLKSEMNRLVATEGSPFAEGNSGIRTDL